MSGSDAGGPGRGQRFYMTLLFSDLSDYTALTETSDPNRLPRPQEAPPMAAARGPRRPTTPSSDRSAA